MRKLMLALIALIIAPASVLAEPQRIKDDPVESPCDNSGKTDKPPCKTDSESIKVPAPMPTEKDSVIVPPDIPAEGLPHQDGGPSSGDSPNKPSR
ncbi:MAG TPA: hypothetical protein VEA39_01040 [Methylophilaceae bacterium]|nr:hypothetical protein [Methylophilaceae bacterium]